MYATKYEPVGVGELGSPGATGVWNTATLLRYRVSVRADRLTTMCVVTSEIDTSLAGIHAVDSLGRTGMYACGSIRVGTR